MVGIAVTPHLPPNAKPVAELDALNVAAAPNPRGVVLGSGTLISADGLILTVESLLAPGEIAVTLDNGVRRQAAVVGRDRISGLALLKIEGIGLPHAALASAKDVAIGERVAILGRQSLESQTYPVVTEGLVSSSALGTGFIQSTAQVLPGMGGGPVVRLKTGELIALASHQYLPRVGTPYTFAVVGDKYLEIAAELRSRGRVQWASIGITADTLPEEVARDLGLSIRGGAVIRAVREVSPAQRSGLQVGDVVMSVDGGETPASGGALYQMIRAKPPGTTLVLRVWRRGAIKLIEVTSEAMPDAK